MRRISLLPTPAYYSRARTRRRESLNSKRAFTLVEMLVATAVLVLLIVLIAQLTNGATMTITGSRNRMDADSQARMIFDRMGNDFANMVKRKDVDIVCKGMDATVTMTPGNDSLYFFSEAPAYSGSTTSTTRSGIALVGYRVNPSNPTTPVLERLGKAIPWDGGQGGMAFLTYATGTTPIPASTIPGKWPTVVGSSPAFSSGTDADYHVVGEAVYRLEFNYLLKPYTAADGTPQPGRLSVIPFNGLPGHTRVNAFQDVSAIVVALAILDPNSRKTVPDGSFAQMITALPSPSGTTSILVAWNSTLPSFLTQSGINKTAAAQMRLYQRYFYLNSK